MKRLLHLIKKIYILFAVLLVWVNAQGNNGLKKDSIVNIILSNTDVKTKVDLFNKDLSFFIYNPSELIEYAQKLLAEAKKEKYNTGIYDLYLSLGVGYCENRQFDSAINSIYNSLGHFIREKNVRQRIRCNNYLGISYEGKTNYTKALWHYFQALNLSKEINDTAFLLRSLNNIAVVYIVKNDYNLAEKKLLDALPLAINHKSELSLINYNLAIIYLEKKEFTKSLAKFELVLDDDIKSNDLKNIAETYNNIGACYLGLNQLSRAEDFLNKSFDIREKINDKNGLRNSYTDLAELHIKNKEFKVALLYLEKAEELAKKAQNLEAQVSVYNAYINCYKAQNDYKKVLIYTELKVDILQNISNSENLVKLKELETQAQARQKAAETEVSAEKQKNELTTRILIITIVVIVLLVLVFLSYSVYNFRKNNAILRSNKAALTLKNEVLIKQNEEILRNQELAKQAVVAKASFIRNISHEVRTPLNAINGVADLISQDNLNQQQIDNIQILKKSTYKLINLINDILDFNNLESGNIDFNSTNFKIQEIVNNLKNLFADKIKDKGLEFIIDNLVDHKLVFKSDSVRISQVLANLLSNSLTFTDQGFIKLTIKTIQSSYVKALVRFEVQDSGTGIDKDKLNTIFEAFTQIDASNTRKIEGAGLGLSISKKIVEGFNSQLEVITERGNGSTFYFDVSLNLADIETYDSNEDVIIKNITSLENKNILIVEDSMVNVIILKQFLKKWGCTFTCVENGLEGLKAVKEQPFDLILMDLQMPVMDGITCTKEIRALTDIYYKTVPIIALTAANENTMRDAAYAVGMNDYILKPFEPKNLQEKMLRAINESLA